MPPVSAPHAGRGWAWWLGRLFAVDFAALMLSSAFLRGDALNGRVVDGHYFVGEHGRFSEVGGTVFEISRLLGYSVLALGVALLLVAVSRPGGLLLRASAEERLRAIPWVLGFILFALASHAVMDAFDFHYHD